MQLGDTWRVDVAKCYSMPVMLWCVHVCPCVTQKCVELNLECTHAKRWQSFSVYRLSSRQEEQATHTFMKRKHHSADVTAVAGHSVYLARQEQRTGQCVQVVQALLATAC